MLDGFESLCAHIHKVNDQWFRDQHPLLTHQRIEELQTKFAKPLPLTEAYRELFTTAEREHLTYEHFLEDWEAYCELRASKQKPGSGEADNGLQEVSFDTAVAFLEEMQ